MTLEDQLANVAKPEKTKTFRNDIVGFRALAVLFVMLHHFNIPGFGGAFYGPDIFFVLSGYLITGSLMKEYAKNYTKSELGSWGQISFKALYLRRARRILPAAILVIAATVVYAFFTFNSLRVSQIVSDSLWTLFFGANITFMRQGTDYFASNYVSPMVHFWSLSVTEQFYFIWPTLFVAVANMRTRPKNRSESTPGWERRVLIAFASVFVFSFIWMLVTFKASPLSTYFSTFSRGWELAVGGLICFASRSSIQSKLGSLLTPARYLALGLVFVSFAFVRDSNFAYTVWVPVFATAFLLASGSSSEQDMPYRFLSLKPLKGIGEISYSMYLWHWPIFVFGTEAGLLTTLWQRFIGIGVTIIFAVVTYWLVERPFLSIPIKRSVSSMKISRAITPRRRIQVTSGLAACLGFIVVLCVAYPTAVGFTDPSVPTVKWQPPATVNQANGQSGSGQEGSQFRFSFAAYRKDWTRDVQQGLLVNRVPPRQEPAGSTNVFAYCPNFQMKFNSPGGVCETHATSEHFKTMVVLGGSHAAMLMPAILGAIKLSDWNVISITSPSCTFLDDQIQKTYKFYSACVDARSYLNTYLTSHRPDLIIVNQRVIQKGKESVLGFDPKVWSSTLLKYKARAKRVILVSPTLGTANIPECATRDNALSSCEIASRANVPSIVKSAEVAEGVGVSVLDSNDYVCATTQCPNFIGNKLVTHDGEHYTQGVSAALAPFFADALTKLKVPGIRTFSADK